jgi:hypothetical protein
MNQHIETARKIYEDAKVDFWGLFEWHMHYGIVICAPDCFALAYFCRSDRPAVAAQSQSEADTIHVTWAGGNMQSIILNFLGRCKYISFHRHIKKSRKIRLVEINKLNSKIQKL